MRLRGRGRTRPRRRGAVSVLVVARVAARGGPGRVHVTPGRTSGRPVGVAGWGPALVAVRGMALLGRRRRVIVGGAGRVVARGRVAARVACGRGISCGEYHDENIKQVIQSHRLPGYPAGAGGYP